MGAYVEDAVMNNRVWRKLNLRCAAIGRVVKEDEPPPRVALPALEN